MNELSIKMKTGYEPLSFKGQNIEYSLIDFWKWMGSDIISNSVRGIFAEYIVGLALDVVRDIRMEWSPFDLSYQGLNIEVKSSAYLQSWDQKSFSKINFSISPTLKWNPETNKYSENKTRSSHFYIFCVLNCKESSLVDPLKLEQWDFYILPTYLIDHELGNQKSLTLSSLKKLNVSKTKFSELKMLIDQIFEKDRLNILSNYDQNV